MKFLVDAQLPPALAEALRQVGHEAQAVRDLGLREAEDETIWDYALANQAVIVTKDQDFADRSLLAPAAKPVPVIVWLRIGNTSNRALLAWLLPLWPDIVSRIQTGDTFIEVREKNAP